MDSLPVDEALPRLKEALAARNAAVLVAPPGAGKTTRVPLALLDAPWLGDAKIVMQEPRRLAARAAARRMAATLGEAVGETVGYRVRLDTKVGPRTRIEVVTDGLFLRMLQDDPSLDGIGCVIFDELHERGLETDLSFALVREAQTALRDDLRVIAMSATLDPGPVSDRLGGAPVISSAGRMFPVDTRYLDREPAGRIEDSVASTVRRALRRRERQRPGVPARRRRDPPRRGTPGSRRQRRRGAALRRPLARRPGSRHRPLARRPAQGRAGDLDRRNQPHHRRRAHRDRLRPDARAAFLAALGHDAARDRARQPGLRRPAPRPRRPPRARRVLSPVARGAATRPAALHAARDPGRRPRAARPGAGLVGRQRLHPALADAAASRVARHGAGVARRSRCARPVGCDHAARPGDGAARPASASCASGAEGPRAGARPGRRPARRDPERARLPAPAAGAARRRPPASRRHRVERQARRRAAADPGAGPPPDAARRGRRAGPTCR